MSDNLRVFMAGISGGLSLNLSMLLTFRLMGFGWNGDGILIRSEIQSPKLVAVWTKLEPLPLIVSNPAPMIIGLILFGIGHAYVYKWISVAWPQGLFQRAFRFAAILFFMIFLFWEFFTPFNQFGEPLQLVALELCFWAIIAITEAFGIAFVMERAGKKVVH